MVGYASYLIPAALVVLGWHYFWCRPLDAIYTKFVGTALLFTSLSGLLALAVGNLEIDGHAFRAGGSVGQLISTFSAGYLNRAGALIVLLTLLFMSVILATQLSFGRMFAFAFQALLAGWRQLLASLREWRENRRRDKQRQEVIAKHAKKSGVKPEELAGRASRAHAQAAARSRSCQAGSRTRPGGAPAAGAGARRAW